MIGPCRPWQDYSAEARETLGEWLVALPEFEASGAMRYESIKDIDARIGRTCGGHHLYERWLLNYTDAWRRFVRKLWPMDAAYCLVVIGSALEEAEQLASSDDEIESMCRWETWAANGYEGTEPL